MSMTEKLQQTGGSFVDSLREAARDNPAAAALIGAGALWLLAGPPALSLARGGARVVGAAAEAGQASAAAAASQWRSARDGAADLAGSAADQVRQAGEGVRDAAVAGGSLLREQGATTRQRVADQFNAGADGLSSARAQLAEMFDRQPLALGAIGLAIGAAVAASLPTTRFEAEFFGETGDALRDRAHAVAQTAADEARRQNLTPEGLKGEIQNTASKVADVATKAAGTFREKMSPSQ